MLFYLQNQKLKSIIQINMKTIKFSSLLIVCLLISFVALAQRREVVVVKKKPQRNIVYVNPSPKVRVVRVVPPEARIIHYRSVPYYFHAGLYYNFIGGRYVVVAPPRGIRVNVLPSNHFYFQFGGIPFYYLEGGYYTKKGKAYEVTPPPVGAIVPSLPDEAEKVTIEGKVFYEYDDTIYKLTETEAGLKYEVVGEK